jgi:endosialidase-like protein
MKRINPLRTVLCMVFVVACLQISALGQSAEDKNNFAAIRASGSSVRWDVTGPYSSLTMTVSAPDGRVFRKEFKAGTSPEFALTDNKGERLPDGQYTYELRLTPVFSPGVTEELAKARAREYAPEPVRDMSKRSATSEALVQKDDSADTLREMRKRGLIPAEPQVKSGGFSILNGAAVVAGAMEEGQRRSQGEPRPTKKTFELSAFPSVSPGGALGRVRQHHMLLNLVPDFVIADDLIVQGSACVGLDCVNGETFNFDTIRTKENNTRIGFMDTSTGTFPTEDWTIRANSSDNGGGSFLAFVDQGATSTGAETGTIVLEVDAGAPANSIRVASTGRVGLRTASPVLDIHTNTSNTPAIRLEQNNSQGFTAQTWDMAGNEANFFVRDVTGGSRLPFRIRPGAPTSSIDIAADGDVGIGTASPADKLDVVGQARVSGTLGGFLVAPRDGTGATQVWYNPTGDDSRFFTSTNGDVVTILNNGRVGIGTSAPNQLLSVNGEASKPTGGSWLVFSDVRLKNIKGNFNSGLKAVMQLQPLRFEYKKDNALGLKSSGEQIGFGAQALEKIIPEAVTRTSTGYLQVNNDPIIWTMLNAIKEQQKEIEQLKAEVRKLSATSRRRR